MVNELHAGQAVQAGSKSRTAVQRRTARLDINKQDGVITIKVGDDLDLRLHDLFLEALEQAQHDAGSRIVVDLSNTRRIVDSGLALLMLLDERSWRLACKVRVENCRPELQHRLGHGLPHGMFNLSSNCQVLEE